MPLRPPAKVKLACSAIVFVVISVLLPVWAQSTPVGLWRSIDDKTSQPKAEIRIKANAAGVLTGVVEKSLAPSDQPLCSACPDDRKDQPKLGLEIIRGAVKAEDKPVWEGGSIIDPDNGRIYKLRLTPVDAGNKLEVRGAFGPFWRTQTWIKVQ
ncbi:MAG: DUF2147 domain-containing protein [Polaromonas sp.]